MHGKNEKIIHYHFSILGRWMDNKAWKSNGGARFLWPAREMLWMHEIEAPRSRCQCPCWFRGRWHFWWDDAPPETSRTTKRAQESWFRSISMDMAQCNWLSPRRLNCFDSCPPYMYGRGPASSIINYSFNSYWCVWPVNRYAYCSAGGMKHFQKK